MLLHWLSEDGQRDESTRRHTRYLKTAAADSWECIRKPVDIEHPIEVCKKQPPKLGRKAPQAPKPIREVVGGSAQQSSGSMQRGGSLNTEQPPSSTLPWGEREGSCTDKSLLVRLETEGRSRYFMVDKDPQRVYPGLSI